MRLYTNLKAKIVADWHDGDTGFLDVDGPFGFRLCAFDLDGKEQWRMRLMGIYSNGAYRGVNAPELGTTANPNPAGVTARNYIQQLCPTGTIVTAASVHWDNYGGRWDGQIYIPQPDGTWLDLGGAMVTAGQAAWMAS